MLYWHWLTLGLILLILELLISSSGFLLWLSAAAFITGIVILFFPLIWPYQIIVFSITALFSIFGWRKVKKRSPHSMRSTLNRRAEQYIGRVFTLEMPVINGKGAIHVDDTRWLVSAKEDLPNGIRVKVTHADGTVLHIEKIE